jgi:hypothetical protein
MRSSPGWLSVPVPLPKVVDPSTGREGYLQVVAMGTHRPGMGMGIRDLPFEPWHQSLTTTLIVALYGIDGRSARRHRNQQLGLSRESLHKAVDSGDVRHSYRRRTWLSTSAGASRASLGFRTITTDSLDGWRP